MFSPDINSVSFLSVRSMCSFILQYMLQIYLSYVSVYILSTCNIFYQLDVGKYTNLCCAGYYRTLEGVKK